MNCYGNLCLFVPTSFRATGWKLLVLNWRPGSDRKLLKLRNTDGYLKRFQ